MIISVINHTNGELPDLKVHNAIRAINRQISEDFAPYWGMSARLRLEGRTPGEGPDPDHAASDMRGDAVLYLWNEINPDGALGYHDHNDAGIPYGFVFTRLSKAMKENWTVTLSHEALELIADPEVNLLVKGPNPKRPEDDAFHWYEMCDAVQDERYTVDGIEVSNFVLPLYFTGGEEPKGRNDFLGTLNKDGSVLKSFGVNPGGYIGFYDQTMRAADTYARQGDQRAEERFNLKEKAHGARRGIRYREPSKMSEAARKPKARAAAPVHR